MSQEELPSLIVDSVCLDALLHPTSLAFGSLVERAVSKIRASVSLGFDKELLEESIASNAGELSISPLKGRVELSACTDWASDVP